jgi:arylsulfatase A-like enzyme
MPKHSRRDFLKILAATPAAYAAARLLPGFAARRAGQQGTKPNVIVVLFDAMSATNLSVYGYPRKTTPSFERFAQHANVYHAHYSAANFTVPGTSSLLTGMHPWTHRAINLSGLVERDLASRNIFELLGPAYHRLGFGQNVMAANILDQFRSNIDTWLEPSAFSEAAMLRSELFPRDANTAYQSLDHFMFDYEEAPGSLILGLSQRTLFESEKKLNRNFPRGIPQPHEYPIIYKLQNVFDGLIRTLDRLPAPYFSYLHIFSPHAPYSARKDFMGIFDRAWQKPQKPESVFSEGVTYQAIEQNRTWYDEYIANVDHEFGRLLTHLEDSGTLENTLLIVTSDHGELLERGIKGHVTPVLYEPLVRVPLLVSVPGQAQGKAFHSPTSSVDLLPSLLSVAGRDVPGWAEGQLLPGLGGEEQADRPIYMMEAKSSSSFGRLSMATFAMRKGKYKITLYRGYDKYQNRDTFELFDLESDPEELDDLMQKEPAVAAELQAEIVKKVGEVDKPPQAG